MPRDPNNPPDPRQQAVVLVKAKLYATLVREPFNVPMKDIQGLTDYQIMVLYFWPTDKSGSLVDRETAIKVREVLDIAKIKQEFYTIYQMTKTPLEEIHKKWRIQWGAYDIESV